MEMPIVPDIGVMSNAMYDVPQVQYPDLIIVDIGMPLLNGIDATRQIKRLLPRVKIIIVTKNEDNYLVAQAFGAGSGYLLKHSASKELLFAIHRFGLPVLSVFTDAPSQSGTAPPARLGGRSRPSPGRSGLN
jgi:CheY-like chemotaxis protein